MEAREPGTDYQNQEREQRIFTILDMLEESRANRGETPEPADKPADDQPEQPYMHDYTFHDATQDAR